MPDDSSTDGQRPEQHGPEMDDTQVEATGELADALDPVTEQQDEQADQASGPPGGPQG